MMIPGEPIAVTAGERTYTSVVLTRPQQRSLLSLINTISKLDESLSSVEKLYDIADQIADICLPKMEQARRDALSNTEIFAIAGEVLSRHVIGNEDKKKFELPPLSDPVKSDAVAVPDVFVSTSD